MVGLALDDGEGAIELLGEDGSHDLVREGHLRERYLAIGTRIDLLRESVWATNHQHQSSYAAIHTLLHPLCKGHATHLLASLVEQHYIVACGDAIEQHRALGTLLLLLREVFGVTQVGQVGYGELGIVVNALGVHLDQRIHLLHIGLAYDNQFYIHLSSTNRCSTHRRPKGR